MNLLDLQKHTENFEKNDWRQVTLAYNGKSKNPKYTIVSDSIKDIYPDVPFSEALYIFKTKIDRQSCAGCGNFNIFRTSPEPGYRTYCSFKCRDSVKTNNSAESIIIDGIVYDDFVSAIEKTGESRFIIRKKIFDPNYPNYQWNSPDHDSKCIEKIKETHPSLADKDFLIKWKESKTPIKELADSIGVSAESVKCALIYFQIDIKYTHLSDDAISLKNNPELLEDLYKKYKSEKIAELYNVSPESIVKWIKMHDIELDKSHFQSGVENYFYDFIKSLDPDLEVLRNDRKTIGMELDLFIPSKKLAIEFDGLFWHSDIPSEAIKDRHSKKQIACDDLGITLLRFVDIEETSDKKKTEIIKSMISNKLGYSQRIFAKNCRVEKIENYQGVRFFEENHISGNRSASIYYGLFHNEELVMVISFGKPFKNKKFDWELIRMASKMNITVVGGASKILKTFFSENSGTLMSYANLRYGNGNSYAKIGFKEIGKTQPGYFYTDLKRIYSRYSFQKKTIRNHCANYDESKTEFENAEANGYKIYYDCGHKIFAYDPNLQN